jgi:hypothetical protein
MRFRTVGYEVASSYDSSVESGAARDNIITLPPEIEGIDALIDPEPKPVRKMRF